MGEKVKRNSFIVSKALRTFVMAAVLTAAASQLAHTADSMIVGHVVGQDAVSAINLVLPLVEVLNCMGFLNTRHHIQIYVRTKHCIYMGKEINLFDKLILQLKMLEVLA